MELIHQKLCSPVSQILLIGRQIEQVGLNPYARLAGPVQVNAVMKPNGLHDHPHFVVSVLAPAQHIQGQIDLSICF